MHALPVRRRVKQKPRPLKPGLRRSGLSDALQAFPDGFRLEQHLLGGHHLGLLQLGSQNGELAVIGSRGFLQPLLDALQTQVVAAAKDHTRLLCKRGPARPGPLGPPPRLTWAADFHMFTRHG
ncbi:MAG: hypothetical protein A2V99_04730 [Spirochaetes bacterium RBG_16_67_19]|nr:MAG: hypothetical protein A2V99_04730 [Spirochaetes bacterium RBG_16_67_19]